MHINYFIPKLVIIMTWDLISQRIELAPTTNSLVRRLVTAFRKPGYVMETMIVSTMQMNKAVRLLPAPRGISAVPI